MERIDIARVAHQINKAYCEALGDTSQANWEDAPEWQKESALNGVNLHLDNPEAGPQASHEAWLKEKKEAGWTHGEKKDEKKKAHPCMVPFEELPLEQQAKDFLFRAVVHAVNEIPRPAPAKHAPHAHVAGMVAVKLVLERDEHTDSDHGTGKWTRGETKNVPANVAAKLLRHQDVYARSEEAASSEVVPPKKEKPDDSKMQETYDHINAMRDKEQVRDFIKTQFNLPVDLRSYKDIGDLKRYAIQLADQYGVLK